MTICKFRGKRSTKVANETKDNILNAAIELFCQHGYEKVSTRDIGKRIGATHTTIHYHFGSKANIWNQAFLAQYKIDKRYAIAVLEEVKTDALVSFQLYFFFSKMMAYHIQMPYSVQFLADAIRFDEGNQYEVACNDASITARLSHLLALYNQTHTAQLDLANIKWRFLSACYSSANLKPLLCVTYDDAGITTEQLLFRLWQNFNEEMLTLFNVDKPYRLNPQNLEQLLISDNSLLD